MLRQQYLNDPDFKYEDYPYIFKVHTADLYTFKRFNFYLWQLYILSDSTI